MQAKRVLPVQEPVQVRVLELFAIAHGYLAVCRDEGPLVCTWSCEQQQDEEEEEEMSR